MTRKIVILAIILTMVALGCSKPNPETPGKTDPKTEQPSTPDNPESESISTKLIGSWRISNSQVDGIPHNLIFQNSSKGVAYDDKDIENWFGLKILTPIEFSYSIKDNKEITIKLITGNNIVVFFNTNYQGDPIINFSDGGNVSFQKTSNSTEIPYSDKKDEPFIKILKITDCTDNTITVQCQIVNSRIFDVSNAQVGAYALVAGKNLNNSVPEIGRLNIEEVGTDPFECVIENLEAETSYEVYSYAVDSRNGMGNSSWGTTSISCTTKAFPSRGDAPITQKGNTVNLGLPSGILWADRNIGSAAIASTGAYFAWGQTKESRSFDVFYSDYSDSKLYEEGIIDSNGHLSAQYDVATQLWGTGWRLPTKDEIDELLENCSWSVLEDTTQGVYGIMGTSKVNGEWIFLPKAGYYNKDGLNNENKEGYYLSSDAYSNSLNRLFGFGYLYFSSRTIGSDNYKLRNVAFSVRPVYKK